MAPGHCVVSVVSVDPKASPPWPDCSVRRVVEADPQAACAAAARLWRASRAAGPEELRLATQVRVHRWGHAVPVELVVAPWSKTKTEVRLELRTMHLPAGYYPRAHDVTDALCAQLQDELARWRAKPQRRLRLVR